MRCNPELVKPPTIGQVIKLCDDCFEATKKSPTTSWEDTIKRKIHQVFQDCIADEMWYESRHNELRLSDLMQAAKDTLFIVFTTERAKAVEEHTALVRREIEYLEKQTRQEKRSEFRLYAFIDVLELPSLTETK